MKLVLVLLSILSLPLSSAAEDEVLYDRDIRPILSDRCFLCHGPNEHDRRAGLRLDRFDDPEGAHQVIEAGSPEDSVLWERVAAEDEFERMPPPDSSKKPLTDEQKEIIRRWIEQGAEYTDFWAFVAPKRPQVPDPDTDWGRQPIDRFVMRNLESKGLTPSPPADRRTLVRRVTFDLTGLPPTREEIREFLADESGDAYERLVDRLLARPQYGEHMAKYWLDLVRFADTNGIHHDHYREMSPYRDWVIRSFNDNLPYNEFAKYQLAGDLFDDPTRDQLIASGFNRLHLIIDRGTALPEESYTRNVIDRVTAVGTAFMGLTVQCAVCHDHKYDPITTKDFYQLFAFFNNFDGAPETGGRAGSDFRRGLQPPYILLTSEKQQAKLDEFDARLEKLEEQRGQIEQRLKQAGDAAEKKTLQGESDQTKKALEAARSERQNFEDTIPAAMVMKERAEPRPAHILVRGAYDNPGDEVSRDTPGFLPPMKKTEGLKTRMDLAEWFLTRKNPLTARVAVNRFWQQLFGVGLVKTSEDFGAQGDWPSHPELLDYLAVSFIESGWDIKALMREIVLSETYRQHSRATPREFKTDPENRLLARGARFRMDSEMIRDQVLATSGLLSAKMFGLSVKPPQPPGLWKAVTMPSSYPRVYEPDKGEAIYRRSVYTFWKRGMPPPQMTLLNAPSRESCIARRERTNTPLQALLLLNEPEYTKAARHLAHETIVAGSQSPVERVRAIYETITSRLPDAEETEDFVKMVEDLKKKYRDNPELAAGLCEGVALREGLTPPELAAWTMATCTIYNLDITKTRE